MRTKTPIIACAVLCGLLAMTASATTLIKMSAEEMAVQADAIILGECVSATSQWVNGTLWTSVTVTVNESLKGVPGSEVTLVIPGGVDATRSVPIALTVPGAPSVFRNENVLLFLRESTAGIGGFDVVGFSQGKYSVVEDASGQTVAAQGMYDGTNGVALDEMRVEIEAALSQ